METEDESRKPLPEPISPLRGSGGLSLRQRPRVRLGRPADDVNEWITAAALQAALPQNEIEALAYADTLRVRVSRWTRDNQAAIWRGDNESGPVDLSPDFWEPHARRIIDNWDLGFLERIVSIGWRMTERWQIVGAEFAAVDVERLGVKLPEPGSEGFSATYLLEWAEAQNKAGIKVRDLRAPHIEATWDTAKSRLPKVEDAQAALQQVSGRGRGRPSKA